MTWEVESALAGRVGVSLYAAQSGIKSLSSRASSAFNLIVRGGSQCNPVAMDARLNSATLAILHQSAETVKDLSNHNSRLVESNNLTSIVFSAEAGVKTLSYGPR